VDENLPARLARILAQLGHESDTVLLEGLAGRTDAEIWEAAQAARSFLTIQDLDFSDIRRFAPETHHGLLRVRLRALGQEALARRTQAVFQTEPVDTWKRAFVVVTDHKLRVRPPSRKNS